LLCLTDPRNYTIEKIEQDKEQVVLFVFEILKNTLDSKLDALVEEAKNEKDNLYDFMDVDGIEESGGDVIAELLKEATENRRMMEDKGDKLQAIQELLQADIRKELDHYMSYSNTTPVETLLNEHPTEKMVKEMEEEEKAKDELKYITKENKGMPAFAGPRFDVLHWWRYIGKNVYPKLSLAAPILLGKPAHNGYQERVFSLGKYCDNTLRNKMRPENFELRVLDTVNKYNDGISKFSTMPVTDTGTQYVKEFFTPTNIRLILRKNKARTGTQEELTETGDVEAPLIEDIATLNQQLVYVPTYPDDDELDEDIDNPFAKGLSGNDDNTN
jgi:hAT family C-terminal dimerisation region